MTIVTFTSSNCEWQHPMKCRSRSDPVKRLKDNATYYFFE